MPIPLPRACQQTTEREQTSELKVIFNKGDRMRVLNLVGLYFYSSFFERGNLKPCILVFVILFLLGGCSHNFIPQASTFELDSITEFSTINDISLVNIQSSTDDVLFGANMGHKFYGNYQEWTDTAIAITRRELSKRGMNIANDVHKSLKLAIETVKGTFGTWFVSCNITLRVETSEGYVKTYFGESRSPAGLYRAADGAVMRTVAEMLRDKEIIAYLKK